MGIRLTLAFSVSLLYLIRNVDCRVQVDRITLDAKNTADPAIHDWHADTRALIRAKRSTSQVSPIEPPSAFTKDANALSQRSKPKDGGLLSGGYEFDNQGASEGPDDTTNDQPAEEEQPADDAGESGEEEIVSPLILYLIVVGIILMTLALLIIGIAILYIICTIPAAEKDEDDACDCGSIKDDEC